MVILRHDTSELAVKLRTHIEETAHDLGCVINWGPPGMMYAEEVPPRIEIPFLVEQKMGWIQLPSIESAYLCGLHELGHIYYDHTQGRPPYEDKISYFENGVLQSEAEAWRYALDNSLVEPSKEDKAFMLKCITTYYDGAMNAKGSRRKLWNGDRAYHSFVYDEPTEFFWAVMNDLGYCKKSS